MGAVAEFTADQIIWETTAKQSDFLACDDFEVLYGGATGGGKSDALLIDALCLQHDGIDATPIRVIRYIEEGADLHERQGFR